MKRNLELRKTAEKSCLPPEVHLKKLSAETTPIMRDLENFRKKLIAQLMEEKILQVLNPL